VLLDPKSTAIYLLPSFTKVGSIELLLAIALVFGVNNCVRTLNSQSKVFMYTEYRKQASLACLKKDLRSIGKSIE